MENPFTIKSYESKELFCDREEELQLMLRNCINSTDMTLFSSHKNKNSLTTDLAS